ncbi:CPBP family intramembrane metalloprotease [Cyanobacterium aponinum FACHB-4101]|uniref:CPBP family intramembrane glutamic endopeptidase n=1 Tax=Cyanobacterium aponinum TaxID=379064 RepID=UPI001680F6C0|nr:type II CAAX endopeptidase family protein [Cyanobacterium aponinum]MBD2394313.1 CPBP family intramembrane metalloprotease [Cyanobacterium aponinum FACHB-4101]
MTDYWSIFNSLGKITIFLTVWAVIWVPIALPLIKLIKWPNTAPNENTSKKLTLIFSLYLLIPFLILGLTKIEGITLEQIGIIFQVRLFKSILFGYALSIFTLFLIYFWEWGLNWITWKSIINQPQRPRLLTTLPLLGFVSIFIASIEELVFRGIFVNFLKEDFSLWLTAIISSLIFALLHLVWEQKNTIPQLPGLFILGLVLFYARIVDDNLLGLAIGLHGGWVLCLAAIDSFNLIDYNSKLPSWIIGNKNQPLGSIAGLLLVLFALLLIYLNHIII